MKTLKIPDWLHEKLKVKAAQKRITIIQLLTEILCRYLCLILILSMIGCSSSKMYTQVNPVNEKKYKHHQKIQRGMSMREVIDKFGDPIDVRKEWALNQIAIVFIYYNAIHCNGVYCEVRFNQNTKEVVSFVNFRQEYVDWVEL